MLDAFQIVSSVVFFAGSVVSTQSAFRNLDNIQSLGTNVKMNDIFKLIENRHHLGLQIFTSGKQISMKSQL
ncbi:hypothetical protein C0J52_02675 [Blattella germanica]|nr:hypothetical protein C0J52_02675 [Blattella germanica]